MDAPPTCPICLRPIPAGAKASCHHLTPRLKGGARKGTVLVHHICHQAIHARFTGSELARGLNAPEAIHAHPAMAEFLAWVAGEPLAFHAPTRAAGGGRGSGSERCLAWPTAPPPLERAAKPPTSAGSPCPPGSTST